MTDDYHPTVLVPVDVSGEERPAPELLALLAPARVVLVGWHPVPDQTAPEQMRERHESAAVERVESIAADLTGDDATADVETLVVFTRDRATTVDRVAEEYAADAVLVPRAARVVERVLVPIRADVNLDGILPLVGTLLNESAATVTLFHVDEDDAGETLLAGAAERLRAAGVDDDRIETVTVEADDPVAAIVEAGTNHDVLVVGESDPSVVDRVLGDAPSQIIERSDRPVVVVRKVDHDDD